MNDIEFNLWDESWIKVKTPDGRAADVSLEEILVHAEQYTDIAGELPTQDFAIMRLCLAILHTALFRNPPEDPQEAWAELWREKHFPADKIRQYKSDWHDRFYLFHPEHPFYQIANDEALLKGKPEDKEGKPVEKLNGEISESDNKKRFFVLRSGKEKESLSYAEAARWLIHYNAFDDASLKIPSPSISFLGQFCCLFAHGRNLFETLMLNLVLEQAPGKSWKSNKPCWESDCPPLPLKQKKETYKIALPDNPAALYTNQFRYMKLKRKQDRVTGFTAQAGLWFEKEDAFVEQMTYWKENKEGHQVPCSYNSPRQMWREFSSIITKGDAKQHASGLIQWLEELIPEFLDSDYIITFNTLGVEYGSMSSQIDNVFFDSLDLHLGLISEVGADWRALISEEISRCEEIANTVGQLKEDLLHSAGITKSGDKNRFDAGRDAAKEQYFYAIDIPFRRWLLSLDPQAYDGTYREKQKGWRETAIDCAEGIGEKLLQDAGRSAYIGREITVGKGKSELYTAPKSFNRFMGKINQLRKE